MTNVLNADKQIEILKLLIEGNSIRSTAMAAGVTNRLWWMEDLYEAVNG